MRLRVHVKPSVCRKLFRAVEEYEARRGWCIEDALRLSTGIARYRQQMGIESR
jgi:hypothetical protein